jgi:hypothetical protein
MPCSCRLYDCLKRPFEPSTSGQCRQPPLFRSKLLEMLNNDRRPMRSLGVQRSKGSIRYPNDVHTRSNPRLRALWASEFHPMGQRRDRPVVRRQTKVYSRGQHPRRRDLYVSLLVRLDSLAPLRSRRYVLLEEKDTCGLEISRTPLGCRNPILAHLIFEQQRETPKHAPSDTERQPGAQSNTLAFRPTSGQGFPRPGLTSGELAVTITSAGKRSNM